MITARDVAEPARDDVPAAECIAVGTRRLFRAGTSGQVIKGLRFQNGFSLLFQLVDGNRLRGLFAGQSRLIDLHLASQAPGGFGDGVGHAGLLAL